MEMVFVINVGVFIVIFWDEVLFQVFHYLWMPEREGVGDGGGWNEVFGQKQLETCVMAIPLEGVWKVCQNRLDKINAFVRNLRRITVLFLYFSKNSCRDENI